MVFRPPATEKSTVVSGALVKSHASSRHFLRRCSLWDSVAMSGIAGLLPERADDPLEGAAEHSPEGGALVMGQNRVIGEATVELIFSQKHLPTLQLLHVSISYPASGPTDSPDSTRPAGSLEALQPCSHGGLRRSFQPGRPFSSIELFSSGNGIASSQAECLGGDPEPRRGLPSLVFVEGQATQHIPDYGRIMAAGHYLLEAEVLLHR